MMIFRSLIRLLIRAKGRTWVVLAAFRVYQRLPRFAQRRVRKRAIQTALPRLVSKLTDKTSNGRR
ncbi:MAG: hypothetical protein ACYDHO_01955 [Gaiellaceae bacterium]